MRTANILSDLLSRVSDIGRSLMPVADKTGNSHRPLRNITVKAR